MLFFRQLRLEIIKLFARKRTWIGFGAFFMLEIVMLFLLQRDGPKRFYGKFIGMAGGLLDEYYRGLTLAFLVLAYSVLLLGALALALVGGDIVAKEVEDGTMRMTLCRPISRLRVLAVKYVTALFYCGVLAVFIGLSAYLTDSPGAVREDCSLWLPSTICRRSGRSAKGPSATSAGCRCWDSAFVRSYRSRSFSRAAMRSRLRHWRSR